MKQVAEISSVLPPATFSLRDVGVEYASNFQVVRSRLFLRQCDDKKWIADTVMTHGRSQLTAGSEAAQSGVMTLLTPCNFKWSSMKQDKSFMAMTDGVMRIWRSISNTPLIVMSGTMDTSKKHRSKASGLQIVSSILLVEWLTHTVADISRSV